MPTTSAELMRAAGEEALMVCSREVGGEGVQQVAAVRWSGGPRRGIVLVVRLRRADEDQVARGPGHERPAIARREEIHPNRERESMVRQDDVHALGQAEPVPF